MKVNERNHDGTTRSVLFSPLISFFAFFHPVSRQEIQTVLAQSKRNHEEISRILQDSKDRGEKVDAMLADINIVPAKNYP